MIAQKTIAGNPAQAAPSGKLAYLSDTGEVTDAGLNVLRTLDLTEPWGHASLSMVNGHDTWNGAVYESGAGRERRHRGPRDIDVRAGHRRW